MNDTKMKDAGSTNRQEFRHQALSDLRRKMNRSSVAMSFMPPAELARHLGLRDTDVARKLLHNERLTQRLYWQLVDEELVPDIASLPEQSEMKLIDSTANFENACESIDIMLALNKRGVMISKDEVKVLATRFGDARVRWAWDNRDIWASKNLPKSNDAQSHKMGELNADSAIDAKSMPRQQATDTKRMLLEHLAQSMPEIAAWMGRHASNPARKNPATAETEILSRVVDRLVQQTGNIQHG